MCDCRRQIAGQKGRIKKMSDDICETLASKSSKQVMNQT